MIEALLHKHDNLHKHVAEELDSLTDETALEVVRLLRLMIWPAHDIVTKVLSFPSLDTYIGRLVDVITECFLYCSLLPDLFFPAAAEYWRSEGFFYDLNFNDEEYSYIMFRLGNAIFSRLEERFRPSKTYPITRSILEIPSPPPLWEESLPKSCPLQRDSTRENKYMVRHSQGLTGLQTYPGSPWLTIRLKSYTPPPPPLIPSTSSAPAASFTNLSTLLLRDNPKLREIPDVVFLLMPNLRVLDLTFTSIQTLPSSISTLHNLRMLSLQGCQGLETIDATGLDMLEVLNLWRCPLRGLKRASWQHLHNLKSLIFQGGAMNLEELNLSVKDAGIFDLYLFILWDYEEERPSQRRQKCSILIMYPGEEEEQDKRRRRRRDSFFQGSRFPYSNIYPQVNCLTPSTAHPLLLTSTSSYSRCLEVFGGKDGLSESLFKISDPEFISLNNNTSIYLISTQHIRGLKSCQISRCSAISFGLFYGPCCLTGLETIRISTLTGDSTTVFYFHRSEHSRDMLPVLRSIYLENCSNLSAIFYQRVDLPNLEVMEIKFCCRLEKVFDEEDATGEMVFPKLKSLLLLELPELRTICDGHLPSLQKMVVRGCWNLRKVPLPLPDHQKDGARKVEVHGELEWWNNNVVQGAMKDHVDFKKQHERVQLKRYPKMWP